MKMNITLKDNIIPSLDKLLELYNNVGWSNYTNNPEMLQKAYENSLLILTAWMDNKLIGVIRIVGDGASIIYIQDILVLEEYQHRGVGFRLFTEAINRYKNVYQKVLLTDNQPQTKAFYEKMGFRDATECGCISFINFNM